jgi:hypothetical protein
LSCPYGTKRSASTTSPPARERDAHTQRRQERGVKEVKEVKEVMEVKEAKEVRR